MCSFTAFRFFRHLLLFMYMYILFFFHSFIYSFVRWLIRWQNRRIIRCQSKGFWYGCFAVDWGSDVTLGVSLKRSIYIDAFSVLMGNWISAWNWVNSGSKFSIIFIRGSVCNLGWKNRLYAMNLCCVITRHCILNRSLLWATSYKLYTCFITDTM